MPWLHRSSALLLLLLLSSGVSLGHHIYGTRRDSSDGSGLGSSVGCKVILWHSHVPRHLQQLIRQLKPDPSQELPHTFQVTIHLLTELELRSPAARARCAGGVCGMAAKVPGSPRERLQPCTPSPLLPSHSRPWPTALVPCHRGEPFLPGQPLLSTGGERDLAAGTALQRHNNFFPSPVDLSAERPRQGGAARLVAPLCHNDHRF